jgi:hypothetical protein
LLAHEALLIGLVALQLLLRQQIVDWVLGVLARFQLNMHQLNVVKNQCGRRINGGQLGRVGTAFVPTRITHNRYLIVPNKKPSNPARGWVVFCVCHLAIWGGKSRVAHPTNLKQYQESVSTSRGSSRAQRNGWIFVVIYFGLVYTSQEK